MIKIERFAPPSDEMWEIIIEGVRNSWESWEKGDSGWTRDGYGWGVYNFEIGPKDHELCMRLIKAGSSHAKFMRQLPVIADIVAPEHFWKQYSTYKIGTTENSTSTMHIVGKEPFTMAMFDYTWPDHPINQQAIDNLNLLRDEWIAAGRKKPSLEWRMIIENIPPSWIYRRTCSLNYEVLRTMAHQRKNHRLYEWKDFLFTWVRENLRYPEFILGPDEVQR